MAIHLTEAAIAKIREFRSPVAREKNTAEEGIFLRVGIKGGGCSGMSYLLEFEDKKTPHDREFEIDGVTIVLDKKSYLYLNGTTIDYVEQGLTGGFMFSNPNAKSSCGCGTSFNPGELNRDDADPTPRDPDTRC